MKIKNIAAIAIIFGPVERLQLIPVLGSKSDNAISAIHW